MTLARFRGALPHVRAAARVHLASFTGAVRWGSRAAGARRPHPPPRRPAPPACARQPAALARQVRLVGIARRERERREVAGAERQEPLEPQHARERLRPVTDRVANRRRSWRSLSPSEGAKLATRAPGRGDAQSRRARDDVRGASTTCSRTISNQLRDATGRDALLARRAPHLGKRHAPVQELLGRQPQRRAGHAEPEPHAEHRNAHGTSRATGPVAGPATISASPRHTMSTQPSGRIAPPRETCVQTQATCVGEVRRRSDLTVHPGDCRARIGEHGGPRCCARPIRPQR